MVHQILIKLREMYNTDVKKWSIVFAISSFCFFGIALTVDHFLPMSGFLYNTLRMFVALFLAASIYSILYFISLKILDERLKDPDNTWIPYRMRFSVKWRRRIAIIIASFLFVIAYATTKNLFYTFVSSLIMTAGMALVAFIRPTSTEQKLMDMGVPDVRDLDMDLLTKKREKIAEEKQKKKDDKKKLKKFADNTLGLKGKEK